MPFPLHKAPRGLLELFRLRTTGSQPNLFAETVSPVVDVTEHYIADQLRTAAATPIVGNLNAGQYLTAGPLGPLGGGGAVLALYGFTGSVTLGAAPGTWLAISLMLEIPVAGPPATLAFMRWDDTQLVAASFYETCIVLPRPLILPGGSTYGAYAEGDAAGADHTLNLNAVIAPIGAL